MVVLLAAVSLRLYALDAAITYAPRAQPGRETLQLRSGLLTAEDVVKCQRSIWGTV